MLNLVELQLSLDMNFLAHAYLSFADEGVLAGNMISDFVKGKDQYSYEPGIFKGIRLHRAIDQFTDEHTCTKEIKQFFRPAYGLYAGAFVDVAYDYFLANDPQEFADELALESFAAQTYQMLEHQFYKFPGNFQQVYLNMRKHNWLANYRHEWGIRRSFEGLIYRARYLQDANPAFQIMERHSKDMKAIYLEFFPLLKKFAFDTFTDLKHRD